MTKRSDRTYHPGDPSAYAPRRVREPPHPDRFGDPRKIHESEVPEETIGARPSPPRFFSRRDRRSAIDDQLAELQSLATMANDWSEPEESRFRFGIKLAPLLFAITVAAGLALFLVEMLPSSRGTSTTIQTSETRSLDTGALSQPPKIADRPVPPSAPQFIATQPSPRGATEEVSYGLASRSTRPPTSLEIGQIPAGAGASGASQSDGEAITTLLNRGEEFLAVGDIATARVLLTRAAEANNARAAFALGSTYDPSILERLGVRGVNPDMTMARTWYQRAKDLGSVEASRRLDNLGARIR